MSRIIFEANGVTLGCFTGPDGKVMFQLSISNRRTEFIQLEEMYMEDLLSELLFALNRQQDLIDEGSLAS